MPPTQNPKTFNELWEKWQKQGRELDETDKNTYLCACLKAAATFDEIRKVHEATFGTGSGHVPLTDLEFRLISSVRTSSLEQLIEIAKNHEEAKIALELASKRKKDGKPRFPAKVKTARARFGEFHSSQ